MGETNNKEIILLKVKVAQLCRVWLFATPLVCGHHALPHPPWDSPGKNIGLGSHSLLQGIFLTQGLNLASPIAGRFLTVWSVGNYEVAWALWRHAQAGWGGRVNSVSIKGRTAIWAWGIRKGFPECKRLELRSEKVGRCGPGEGRKAHPGQSRTDKVSAMKGTQHAGCTDQGWGLCRAVCEDIIRFALGMVVWGHGSLVMKQTKVGYYCSSGKRLEPLVTIEEETNSLLFFCLF